jgi:hypothetical protein
MPEELIEQFIATFDCFNDLSASRELNPIAWQLAVGEPDQFGEKLWKPLPFTTDRKALDELYAEVPATFPPLYEQLILSYRWAAVDLGDYALLANPPGPDFSGLLQEMTRDKAMWNELSLGGYLQFGRGPDLNYDPVCFGFRGRGKGRDCRIVQIDHEEILCNNRVKEVAELAGSFRELILKTIEDCKQKKAV